MGRKHKAKGGTAAPRGGAGRAHLDLQRDPSTGRARLVLKEPIFHDDWQNHLATAAANTALGTLREQPSLPAALELAGHAMDVASQLCEEFLARLPEGTIACKSGCAHCCHQTVHVTPIEALAIVDHLMQSLSTAALASLAGRISEARERTRGLAPLDRFASAHPCPFLAAGQCSVYQLRPLACRGMNSRDAVGCAKVLHDREVRAVFLADPRAGYSFAEPIRIALAISAGLQLGLSEVYHLDMHPLELTAAVDLLLRDAPTLVAGWLSGQAAFAPAYAADPGNQARMSTVGGLVRRSPASPARG